MSAVTAAGVAAGSVVLVGWLLGRVPIGVRHGVGPVAHAAVPGSSSRWEVRLLRRWRRWRERRQFERDLPRFAEAVARELRAGAPLRDAVLDGATACGPPISGDVGRIRRRLDAGVGLATVLAWWADDRRAPELTRLALVSDLGGRLGGGVAEALDGLASAMDDRRDAAAEARAHSSQARASAVLLVAAPVVFGATMGAVDPRSTRFLFATPAGWITLVVALALDALGGWWMYRLTERVR